MRKKTLQLCEYFASGNSILLNATKCKLLLSKRAEFSVCIDETGGLLSQIRHI